MARPFDICIRGAGITGRVLALPARLDLRSLERALCGHDTEVGGGYVAKPAAEGAEGGARTVDDDDVLHLGLPLAADGVRDALRVLHCPTAALQRDQSL